MRYNVYKSNGQAGSFMFTDAGKDFPAVISDMFRGEDMPAGMMPESIAEEFDGPAMTVVVVKDDGSVVDAKTDAAIDVDPVEMAEEVRLHGYYIVDECAIESYKEFCIRHGYSYIGDES